MNQSHPGRLEVVADGFSWPTGIAFDDDDAVYIAESGLPFDGEPAGGKIWRLDAGGQRTLVASNLGAPVTGISFYQDGLFVSENGGPGLISRIDRDGRRTTILSDLPGPGNYHTNMTVFGPDGKLYFSQGAMTNSGIVGLDAFSLPWLQRLPHACDIPGYDVVLAGADVETDGPPNGRPGARFRTGAFSPFGSTAKAGSLLRGRVPCTAAVMRCNPDGSDLELVAWGLRNAFGLCFLPDGRLLATDQGADERGSRPVRNAPDLLFEVTEGDWYGWPDYIDAEPITSSRFRTANGRELEFVLANHGDLPPAKRALMQFPMHAAAVKLDYIPEDAPIHGGHILVAQFGDEKPMTAPSGGQVGRNVGCIDPRDWSLRFILDSGLCRPIDVKYSRKDGLIYVLDFGYYEVTVKPGILTHARTGKLLRLRI
jgi:glucose/arabinose dehydrogenase